MAIPDIAALLGVALAAGVAGSVHCAAMCGGIASATSLAAGTRGRQGLYAGLASQLARVGSYATLGAVCALLARSATAQLPAGYERAGRLLLALCMGLVALRMLTRSDWLGLERLGTRAFRWMAPMWSTMLRAPRWLKPVALGVIWGFMPCGLVYSMLPVATASADPLLAAASMAMFGLGTVPAVAGIGATLARASSGRGLAAPRVRMVAGSAVLVCALWTALGAFAHHDHAHAGHAGAHEHTVHSLSR